MKFRYLLCVAPVSMLWACTPTQSIVMSCESLGGKTYSGRMLDSSGAALGNVSVTIPGTGTPGFKHNVIYTPPNQPSATVYDGECANNTAPPPVVTITVYPDNSNINSGNQQAVWQVGPTGTAGFAFHLHDPGSRIFPHGADGDFK
jgi:hypothetical protein